MAADSVLSGKIVGKASDADGKTARISFGLMEVADVKGDLHEAAKSAAAEPTSGTKSERSGGLAAGDINGRFSAARPRPPHC